MDVITKAIALRATDYKENDKYVLLYSLEYGKISILARGIRKPSAKLKFAADQFCFGQYELARTDDRFTLKTCEQLESFYTLREDVLVYYASCVVAECLINYTEEGQSEPLIFVESLKALETLACKGEPLITVLRFVLKFLELSGIKLRLDGCVSCGKISKHFYLSSRLGGLVCDACHEIDNPIVSPRVLAACRMVDGIDYEKLSKISVSNDILKEALAVCNKYVSHCYFPLKSLSEFLKIA